MPREWQPEIKVTKVPMAAQLRALSEFAKEIETLATERNDGELITKVKRLDETMKRLKGEGDA